LSLAEERQDQNAKRRKVEQAARAAVPAEPQPQLAFRASNSKTDPRTIHPSLPMRPSFDTFAAPSPTSQKMSQEKAFEAGSKALGGTNSDIVANRSAIRMANMSAAEALKAELSALKPLKPKSGPPKTDASAAGSFPTLPPPTPSEIQISFNEEDIGIPGLEPVDEPTAVEQLHDELSIPTEPTEPPEVSATQTIEQDASSETPTKGVKRKIDELDENEGAGLEDDAIDDKERLENGSAKKRVVHSDGTVESEDTVKLWEPGYRQRYYEQKFGGGVEDVNLRKTIAKCYIEGLAWVLAYYYQGAPSWKWFYPYHYAPFAADFENVIEMQISFDDKQPPFKPFEQLMSVFPAASRKHIPEPFHRLMLDENSPIIEFYPSEFEIDMNGKKMAWQGVALLPFIEEKRLLKAMTPLYDQLTEEEVRRNKWGSNLLFVSGDHSLHPFVESLYAKRKSNDPLPLEPRLSRGMAGSVLPDPQCIPGATYYCPLEASKLPNLDPPLVDIYDDRSLSSLYYFPKQLVPHRSALLNGFRRPLRVLSSIDYENVRRGVRGRGGPPAHHSMHREMSRPASNSERNRMDYSQQGGGYHNYYNDYGYNGYDHRGYGYGQSNGSYRRPEQRYNSGYSNYDDYYPARGGRGR